MSNERMPMCACGHGWAFHVIPGGAGNIDIYPTARWCVDCACRNYERSAQMASKKIREVEIAIESALLRQRDELLAALNGLIGLVQLVDSRDDMPIKVADNYRYTDALALVNRIQALGQPPSVDAVDPHAQHRER